MCLVRVMQKVPASGAERDCPGVTSTPSFWFVYQQVDSLTILKLTKQMGGTLGSPFSGP